MKERDYKVNTPEMGLKVIENAAGLPGVRVDRNAFLYSVFGKKYPDLMNKIIALGPPEAGIPGEEIKKLAKGNVLNRTLQSTGLSFAAGIPGGLAMGVTIPADTLQFYAMSLHLAQETAYLYGEQDIFNNGSSSDNSIPDTLLLYCGVMFGSNAAVSGLRLLSSQLGKVALKRIPAAALTKTFYYPLIKSVVKFFGGRMTKDIFGKAVSKSIPVVGGLVCGGITYATLKPMGLKLVNTFDSAKFSYTEKELENDILDLKNISPEIAKEE